MTGMHAMVLDGRPVWLLVLHELVVASYHGVYIDRCLDSMDFVPVVMKVGSAGWRFLDEVRRGYEINWSDRHVSSEQANHVLVTGVAAHAGEVHDPGEIGGRLHG